MSVREINSRVIRANLAKIAEGMHLNGATETAVDEAIRQMNILAIRGEVKVTCPQPGCQPWIQLLEKADIVVYVKAGSCGKLILNEAFDPATGVVVC